MKYKLLRFSLLGIFAMLCGTVFANPVAVTMKYTGTTTTNMTGGNDAALLGLNADEWSVMGAKGGNTNFPGLNKAGDIRLYYHKDGSNTITVASLTGSIINNISMTFTDDQYSNVSVKVGDNAVEASDGVYTINSTSFVLSNANTDNVQVRISKVVINYTPSGVLPDTRLTTTIDLGVYSNTGYVGDELELPVPLVMAGEEVVEDAPLTWTSDNETVAAIDGNVIQLQAVGTSNITVSFAGNDSYKASSASYALTVKKVPVVEDGVFDFSMDHDYGSGIEHSSVKVQESTWTAVNVVMNVSGRNCWFTDNKTLRLYKNNAAEGEPSNAGTLLFSVPEGKVITKIVFTGNAELKNISADSETYNTETLTWEGSAKTVKFSVNDDAQTVQIYTITVTYADEGVEPQWVWRDIKADLTQLQDLATGSDLYITVAEDGTISQTDNSSIAAATLKGNWHGTSYGWSNFTASVPVEGCVKITYATHDYGNDITVTNSEGTEVAKLNTNGPKWSSSHDNVVVAYYRINEPTTLHFSKANYNPYFAVEAIDPADLPEEVTVYNITFAAGDAEEGVAPSAIEVNAGQSVALPKNYTLYKEEFTLTGWSDGTKAYAVGESVTPEADMALTAVFTENNITIEDFKEAVTFTFALNGNAGRYAFEGNKGIIVTQANVNGKTIDVKADVDATNGKFTYNNSGWHQVNTGTKVTVPSYKGAKFAVSTYNDAASVTFGGKTGAAEGNTATFEATSDAEELVIEQVSSNYWNSLTITQPAITDDPSGEDVTLDNEPATVTFPFHNGTEGQTATFSNADYFLNSKVTHGEGLVLEGKDNKNLSQTWFNPEAKDSKAAEGNAIRFLFTPKPGFEFTPTKVSFNTTRFGTNGGKLDIAWQNPDGTTVALASDVQPNRDNANPNVSALSYNVAGANAAEGTCGLLINLYSLDHDKRVGFSDIVIEGTLSGTEKDIPILASFKVNGTEYSVEDVFGEDFEATLELKNSETMVSAENPLTDVTAASGEIGEISYEGTASACTVTIPMTAGETSIDYVLNVVYKPYFTLQYLDVEGNELAKQTVEKDAKIGEFAYDIATVPATKDGFKARGWFKQSYLGEKFTTEDVITADTKLYALETEIEVPSTSRKYVFDLTNPFFYDEDHEGYNSIGTGYWHDKQHGWAFNNGDKIELLVGPKATINFSLCKYSKEGAMIDGSNGASISAAVENDGEAGSLNYEGEAGTLTLTINSSGAVYIHSITVFNTTETNYDREGDWLIVKQGDASSLLDAIEMAKGIEGAKIFLPDGTYDLGETVKTIISGKNVSLIGQSAENTIITTRPPMEGLGTADLLNNTGEGLYMQDISLKNDYSYGGNDGRAASIHDQGTMTIGKNVFLLSHQDTYYSHRVGGLFYWEGGELHGTVDYLCGNGKAYFNEVKLVNEVRGSATISANSELYVFNNCTVENNAGTYNFGRAWSDNPVCIYLNTTLLDGGEKLASTRWNLAGLNCDYSIAGEYGTKDAEGNDITPASNVVTFTKQNTKLNTILDASALTTYSIENVLGDWAAVAQASTRQVEAPAATYENGKVTWTPANNGAIAYALFLNGKFVGLTEGSSFDDVAFADGDELTIRAANARGGFGAPAVVTVTTGISEMATDSTPADATIYNMQGIRVEKAQKGLYIINGRKVVVK